MTRKLVLLLFHLIYGNFYFPKRLTQETNNFLVSIQKIKPSTLKYYKTPIMEGHFWQIEEMVTSNVNLKFIQDNIQVNSIPEHNAF